MVSHSVWQQTFQLFSKPSRSGCAGRRLTSDVNCEPRPAQPGLPDSDV